MLEHLVIFVKQEMQEKQKTKPRNNPKTSTEKPDLNCTSQSLATLKTRIICNNGLHQTRHANRENNKEFLNNQTQN